ncbi:MAG: ATP synthase F1 subunit delta [Winogradskyella sp.]|uniref:ATP synthase F1 subunit delta n=1 Tax=Winogradskyella sp. TaxID=1883156 RepID=UPI0025D97DD1|nr:ATP synthase F1 subunit delta [Winogradskyella sp.]NRB59520.1 ATP synthase F1 subunit delta [Winogradskyella sp.]
MAGTRAAIRYAKAVLDLAQEQKVAEAVNADMKAIANTISENEDLDLMLQSSVIKSELKKDTLLKVFTKLNSTTTGLLDVLISNKRIDIIGAVANKYQELYDKAQGIVEATVTTAVPLTKEIETKALAKVKELTGSDKVVIANTVNEDIIGGFILRVGDKEYNASIANQLNKLKREFTLN